jgi:hypothetical protein
VRIQPLGKELIFALDYLAGVGSAKTEPDRLGSGNREIEPPYRLNQRFDLSHGPAAGQSSALSIKFEPSDKSFLEAFAAINSSTVCEGIEHMTDGSNSMFSFERLPVPIYDAMLGRALKLLEAGSKLEAVEMLTTDLPLNFHPAAG